MTELPQNWIEVPFTKPFDIQGGTQPPKSSFIYEEKEGYIRLLQIRDFGKKPVPTYIPIKKTLKTCVDEDVLIARYGASIGRILTGMTGAYNVAIAKVLIPDNIDKRFVFHLLNSSYFQEPILSIERSAQDGFNKDDLSRIYIPLPPLNEQKRIVKKLDAIIPKVDEVNSRLERVPLILKRARQSILNQAITGELTKDWRKEHNITESWETTTFKSIATKLTDGSHNPPPQKAEGYPVISAKNIKNNQIVIDNVERYTDEEGFLKENKRTNIKYGDIILGIIGASIGNIAIYKLNQKVIAQRSIAIIDTNINNEYVYYYMSSQIYQNCLIDKTKGAAQGGVYLSELSSIEIRVPTIEEQEEIVKQVKKAFEKLDKIEEQYKKAKSYTDRITQSILHKAFTGNLVPQDPNDKPVELPE